MKPVLSNSDTALQGNSHWDLEQSLKVLIIQAVNDHSHIYWLIFIFCQLSNNSVDDDSLGFNDLFSVEVMRALTILKFNALTHLSSYWAKPEQCPLDIRRSLYSFEFQKIDPPQNPHMFDVNALTFKRYKILWSLLSSANVQGLIFNRVFSFPSLTLISVCQSRIQTSPVMLYLSVPTC